MRKSQTILVSALDDQGNGIASGDGERIVVPFSIPGESWQRYSKLELLEASSDRVTPPCPYFTRCGGCQLQHLNESRQAFEKQSWLRRSLHQVVPQEKILPLLASPKQWHYRRRIQLHVGPKGEVGFYATKSRQVVAIEECRIAAEPLNQKIPEVRRRAEEVLQAPKKPSSLSYELTLQDDGEVEIRQDGEERSFLQVNPEANAALIQVLRQAMDKLQPKRVLELFAGSGNLSFPLVKEDQEWIAVESDSRAVAAGERLAGNKILWKQGEAAKTAERFYQAGQRFDLVLLDPPRGGAEDCLPVFRKWRPPAVLYVSCHAPILRKDLQILQNSGYQVEWVQPIDFFPQTMNLETVVFLRINKG